MKSKKLSQRKHSRLVTDAILEAETNLSHLSSAEKALAKLEYLRRKEQLDEAPEHIKIIRKFGIAGALLGYADEDVEKLIAAKAMLEREIRQPGDFVSAKSFSAGQANGNGKKESYDHDEIRQEARRIGYFELKKGSHGRGKKRLEIVKNLKLNEGNPATSEKSWNRTISRILDK